MGSRRSYHVNLENDRLETEIIENGKLRIEKETFQMVIRPLTMVEEKTTGLKHVVL
ncbi:MAG: hypothetical protein JXR56_04055 [Candidatus Cloacimonetes bacterium]|nr:hypothetical protein [Candidatus Cloacimonadota bacterium]